VNKYIVDNTYYISQDMGVRKGSYSKSDLQDHPRSLVLGVIYHTCTISISQYTKFEMTSFTRIWLRPQHYKMDHATLATP